MIVGLIWALISFHYLTLPTNGDLVAGHPYSQALVGSVLGAIVLFTISFGLTFSHIVWYQSEFLPLEIRAVGSAVATASCWAANLVVTVAYLSQLKALGAAGTYGLYLGFISISWIFVWFCYPETKGLSIDETSEIFANGYGVKKAENMRHAKQEMSARIKSGGV